MAAATPTTVLFVPQLAGSAVGIYTAVVNTNDTVTLTDFTDILNRYVISLAANSEATATIATNIVTVTQALTTAKVLIYVQGN
jgi:hypothetical protein